jgi:hypothetical protein
MWAENAGRRVGQKDLSKLAKVLSAVDENTRMLFFATCAAENKNRQLRLIALGDLAQNRPPANVFDRSVRLVEAAPTWRLDRSQGARTLLLALGDRRVDATEHQMVAWAWRLARASRDAQFRKVAAALDTGRSLARGLAGKSGDELMRAARLIATTAQAAPLDLGAALLAVVQTSDPGANRILEQARVALSSDAAALAAALGTNIPLPRGTRRPGQGPERQPREEPAAAEAASAAETNGAPAESPSPAKKRKRRRRRRRSAGANGGGEEPATAAEPADAP